MSPFWSLQRSTTLRNVSMHYTWPSTYTAQFTGSSYTKNQEVLARDGTRRLLICISGAHNEKTRQRDTADTILWPLIAASAEKHELWRCVGRFRSPIRDGSTLGQGGIHLLPPDSKASWPFWRDFWAPKMFQILNFPRLHPDTAGVPQNPLAEGEGLAAP